MQFLKHRDEHIYGRKFGLAQTLEVFQPLKPNGLGSAIVVILSEGWYSDSQMIDPILDTVVSPLLENGHVVMAVTHSSNPKFTMIDALDDVHQAIRFIRYRHKDFGLDADRIGVMGWSAGGQLALSLACQPRPGLKSDDSVAAQTSHIAAAVVYFAIIDFLNWDGSGKAMLGDHPAVPLYGAFAFDKLDKTKQQFDRITDESERRALAKALSPIQWACADQAPCRLIVAEADTVVPPEQADRLAMEMSAAGAIFDKIIIQGGTHDMETVGQNITPAIDWFSKHI